tara:strand:+ start:70 stop:2604 length:2535 start_codon:yes stop_codon:yes gene_type:complete
MSTNQFIPNLQSETNESDMSAKSSEDSLVSALTNFAQYIVMSLFVLIPLFFTPGLLASLGFDKVLLAVVSTFSVVITASFMSLRKTKVMTVLPLSLGFYWLMVLAAFVSALYSGDAQDALRGSVFEVQTVGFLAVTGLVMTVPLVMQNAKRIALRAVGLFFFSASLLLLYVFSRIWLGASFLSFGAFTAVTVSPVGNFNDLAMLSGLVVVASLISMSALPLRTWMQAVMGVVVLIALLLLSVVNFFNIWVIVGFFGLLMLIYILTQDTLFGQQQESAREGSRALIVVTTLVCLVSAVFIVAGDYAGNFVRNITTVEYAEVIPSNEGTLGIARAVFEDSALLGVGPNRFADAWRLHKDPAINETIFWDTDFNTGSGFITTLFINTGLLGGLVFLAFHLAFLYLGYKILVKSQSSDRNWRFIGSVSFAIATFVWTMTYVYEPGTVIILIGALFTGLTFVAAGALMPNSVRKVSLVTSRQRGFVMMAVVIVLVSNLVMSLLNVSKQYVAQANFTQAQNEAASIDEFEVAASEAFELYQDDRFVIARAQIKLAELNALLNLESPTEADQQQFLSLVEQARIFADQAIEQDDTNPNSHAIMASVYSGLAIAGINGASDLALESLEKAKALDPMNPGYNMMAAQMAARIGDLELARAEIAQSLNLKPNYTEALFLLAQLDISEGNTESAIETTRAIITLEPTNPTRYFQLGMLEASVGNTESAIAALEMAIRIDPQYANARFMLARAYVVTGRNEEALDQLDLVSQTNPGNPAVESFVEQIKSGELSDLPELGLDVPLPEESADEEDTDIDVSRETGSTDLVSPVNAVSDAEEEAIEQDEEAVTQPETEE